MFSDSQIEQYREQGYIFVPQLLGTEWLSVLATAFQKNLDNPSPWAGEYQRKGGRFFTDNSNFSVIQEMQDVLYDSPIVDAMAELMGTEQAWLYYDQIFFKEGEAVRTGWHQDIPYYVMDYTDQVTGAWISLDPLPASMALEVVPRSHRGPMYNPVNPKKPTEGFFDVGNPPVPDIEADRGGWEIISFDTQPGDVLIFHPQMLHGGAPMVNGQRRRTVTLNVFGPEARFCPRPDGHAPTFPGLEDILQPGEPLWEAAGKGFFHQLRPVPDQRLGARDHHDMMHGRAV